MSGQQKTKVGVAYARLGKTASKPKTPDQTLENNTELTPKRCERKTATISQEILGQMALEDTQYLARLSSPAGLRSRHTRSVAIESVSQEDVLTVPKSSNQKLDSARFGVQVKSKFFCDTIRQKDTRNEQPEKAKVSTELKPIIDLCGKKNPSSPQPRGSHKTACNSPPPGKIEQSTDDDFLEFMDSYVYKLSMSKAKRTPQQDQSSEHSRLTRKLELYERKFREMQLGNQLEMKKMVGRDAQMRSKIHRLEEHLSELSLELEQERLERKRFQLLFAQFQSKMRNMRRPTPFRLSQRQSFGLANDESLSRDLILDSEIDKEGAPQSHRTNKKSSRKDSQSGKGKSTGKFFCTKRLIEKGFSDEECE